MATPPPTEPAVAGRASRRGRLAIDNARVLIAPWACGADETAVLVVEDDGVIACRGPIHVREWIRGRTSRYRRSRFRERTELGLVSRPSRPDADKLRRQQLTYFSSRRRRLARRIGGEINRIKVAIDETRDNYRQQFAENVDGFAHDDAETMLMNGGHRRDPA